MQVHAFVQTQLQRIHHIIEHTHTHTVHEYHTTRHNHTFKWVEFRVDQRPLSDVNIPWLHLCRVHADTLADAIKVVDQSPRLG